MLWCDIYLLALLRHNRPQWDAKPINRNSPTTHHSQMQHASRPSRMMQVEQYLFNFMFCKGTKNTFRLLRYISFKESNTKWKCKAKATFPHSFVIHKKQLQGIRMLSFLLWFLVHFQKLILFSVLIIISPSACIYF